MPTDLPARRKGPAALRDATSPALAWLFTSLLWAGSLLASSLLAADVPSTNLTNRVTLPFELKRGHLMVPAVINDVGPRQLMLDTGYTMTMLEPRLADELKLRRVGSVTIVGIAGEEEASQLEGPTFRFQGLSWTPRRVAAFPAGGSSLARSRDGVLGSGFFRRFVVEIDWTRRVVTLHDPGSYRAPTNASIVPLRFRRSTPIVAASLTAPDQPPIQAEFELDLGCDGCLCLGQPFAASNKLTSASGAVPSGRAGVGGDTSSHTRTLTALDLGGHRVHRPEANVFEEGSPADPGLAGHIGLEAFRGFHVVLDYSRRQLLLRPLPR